MPASLHKIHIHGQNIIDSLSLLIGFYSEEAGESRNKDTKNYRLYHSRKDSRIHTNEDQIHYLCATSDPFISSIRQRKNKYRKMKTKMQEETYALIEENEKPNEYESSSESDNESLKNKFGKQMVYESSNHIRHFENYYEKTDLGSEMPDHFFL